MRENGTYARHSSGSVEGGGRFAPEARSALKQSLQVPQNWEDVSPRELFEVITKLAQRTCRTKGYEAEDVSSEVAMRLMVKLRKQIDPNTGELWNPKDNANLKAMLSTTVAAETSESDDDSQDEAITFSNPAGYLQRMTSHAMIRARYPDLRSQEIRAMGTLARSIEDFAAKNNRFPSSSETDELKSQVIRDYESSSDGRHGLRDDFDQIGTVLVDLSVQAGFDLAPSAFGQVPENFEENSIGDQAARLHEMGGQAASYAAKNLIWDMVAKTKNLPRTLEGQVPAAQVEAASKVIKDCGGSLVVAQAYIAGEATANQEAALFTPFGRQHSKTELMAVAQQIVDGGVSHSGGDYAKAKTNADVIWSGALRHCSKRSVGSPTATSVLARAASAPAAPRNDGFPTVRSETVSENEASKRRGVVRDSGGIAAFAKGHLAGSVDPAVAAKVLSHFGSGDSANDVAAKFAAMNPTEAQALYETSMSEATLHRKRSRLHRSRPTSLEPANVA